jgi:DNA mismatch repair protein MutL
MKKIIVLDETLISKIAAGEVIERPASVVKELVENSIDAGAKKISVEIKDGGKRSIKVVDDGGGMGPEDARLAVERHATSKLKSADDLFSIRTLGFRGEALPSIAGISKFELITNDGGSNGSKVVIDGGKSRPIESSGSPAGTTVTVEDLFYNTPARLKFQKGKTTEVSHITEIVSKFILSNPQISFDLKSDGKKILSSIGSGNLLEAVASVYGTDMAKAMLEVRDKGQGISDIKVHGYVSQPVITKSDRYGESFFVNGRFVRNMLLSRALENAYRTLIPNDKYPIAVIFVDIDPKEIDVNVHPTKREVKFAKPDVAMNAITSAVASALGEVTAGGSKQYDRSQYFGHNEWKPEMMSILEKLPMNNDQFQIDPRSPITDSKAETLIQLNLTYIMSIQGEDLVIIDQHAAHERIMYEKFKNRTVGGTQNLLVPKTIEMDPREFALISGNLDEISDLGFDIEIFGKNTVNVRGVPAALGAQNIDTSISEILSELSSSFSIKSIDERREAVWKMMACKAAVKAGDRLSYDEMSALLKELYGTSNPTTCPHGRPTLVRISRSSMEKMFGR